MADLPSLRAMASLAVMSYPNAFSEVKNLPQRHGCTREKEGCMRGAGMSGEGGPNRRAAGTRPVRAVFKAPLSPI